MYNVSSCSCCSSLVHLLLKYPVLVICMGLTFGMSSLMPDANNEKDISFIGESLVMDFCGREISTCKDLKDEYVRCYGNNCKLLKDLGFTVPENCSIE